MKYMTFCGGINPLSSELNPICYLLALLAHDFLHVSRIRVKSLTLRLLMSYIYDISRLRVKEDCASTSKRIINYICWLNTGYPTRYRTRHFFNNSNTNEDTAMKFEQENVRCLRNVMTS
jgi:hypothetical protein